MRFVAALTMALLAASAANAKDRYFPVVPLDSSQQLDDFNIAWYSKHLAAMNEPSLWIGAAARAETYRILWLRSFHAPMAFRLTIKSDGTSVLLTKKLDGQGGYEPGKLVLEKTTEVDKKETGNLLVTLEQAELWDIQSQKKDLSFDGAHWIVEGIKDGKYHVVDRKSDESVIDWALLLMKKSRENLQPIY